MNALPPVDVQGVLIPQGLFAIIAKDFPDTMEGAFSRLPVTQTHVQWVAENIKLHPERYGITVDAEWETARAEPAKPPPPYTFTGERVLPDPAKEAQILATMQRLLKRQGPP